MANASSSYAVIRSGGKQYRVAPGQKISVEKLDGDIGSAVELADVLLVGAEGGQTTVGTPLIKGAKVQAKIVAQTKDKKVLIFKKRRRKGYTKKQGHRQQKTQLLIEAISA